MAADGPRLKIGVVIGASNREKVIHVAGNPEILLARLASL